MRCVPTAHGRRFYPAQCFDDYLATAYAGGLAVLINDLGLSSELLFSYRAMWLFFQRARASRVHLDNTLKHSDSLRVCRRGRELKSGRSLLPESVGMDSYGRGMSWSVGSLLSEGRQEAEAHGKMNPREPDCIRYGLLRAAKRNPLRLDPRAAQDFIRAALYQPLECAPPDARTAEQVVGRTLAAMQPRMSDNSSDFDRWFWGPKNSLLRQIAKQKKSPGGAMDRATVRQVLVDQGWQGCDYVADCLHAMLHTFRRLLPTPLTERENQIFERMHLKQPMFGDLPLMMLGDRFHLLAPILEDVWVEPDNAEAVAVMYRLLDYYGEMATARRAADRLVKARGKGATNKGQAAVVVDQPPDDLLGGGYRAEETNRAAVILGDLAEQLCKEKGVSCGCADPSWKIRSHGQDDVDALLTLYCEYCPFEFPCKVPLSRLRELAGAAG
jgi:hypothetical protein